MVFYMANDGQTYRQTDRQTDRQTVSEALKWSMDFGEEMFSSTNETKINAIISYGWQNLHSNFTFTGTINLIFEIKKKENLLPLLS